MVDRFEIVVLYGGESGERKVSLQSAARTIRELEKQFPLRSIRLDSNELPKDLTRGKDLIFPLIHGEFGEDGRLQALLENEGYAFVGSGSQASALCMDKLRSRHLAQQLGIPVLPALELTPGQKLDKEQIRNQLGTEACVLKPVDQGSSLNVYLCDNLMELQEIWHPITRGRWMLERRVQGRELTLGLLQTEALGVGEICPRVGFYNYDNKYTPGACRYLFPAPLDGKLTENIQHLSRKFFAAAQCLDFGRTDFLLEHNDNLWFLEMNTIPGMTNLSLFPQSAACVGLDFGQALQRIVTGAAERNRRQHLL
jgi:D-alanine-D-alanine ligase